MSLTTNLAYLGAPYSDPDPRIRKLRLQAVNQLMFELTKQGQIVYSPLTHDVPIDRLGIFGDWEVWKAHNHCMLSRCDKLLVYKLPGWEQSKGLQGEITLAKELSIPIEEIEPRQSLEAEDLEDVDTGLLKQLLDEIHILTKERDWEQFHSPKNLAMSLSSEALEVADHFIWVSEEQSKNISNEVKALITEELGDVLINLVHLSDKLNIDLMRAAFEKIEKIKQKYPSDKYKGKHSRTFLKEKQTV